MPAQDANLAAVRARFIVSGVVQGVGFRPFVYRLALRHCLAGWVFNSSEGVVIEVEGTRSDIRGFQRGLLEDAPPRASIASIDHMTLPPAGYRRFAIQESRDADEGIPAISPDIGICDDCLTELHDPANRRYLYPFTNCTSCGPRFTIITGVPYDRASTTMASFKMCGECAFEYHDVTNRRFHAQPNACPACGPQIWLTESGGRPPDGVSASGVMTEVRSRLRAGEVVAIKGLGGFHLACDATSDTAVGRLREGKRRSGKPFAVMVADASAAETLCYVSPAERQLLESPQRPIVLLRVKSGSPVSSQVAPGSRYLGVMLPYTPLHHLLFGGEGEGGSEAGSGESAVIGPRSSVLGPTSDNQHPAPVLVMTSGNVSDEPIALNNDEALEKLSPMADSFLLHDRDIHIRCDDSVTRVFRGGESVLRRSRGYAPFPVRLGFDLGEVLACGAQLKNAFCITRGSTAFLSQHIGDLDNEETLRSLANSVEHFRRLFKLEARGVAHDLHPEYLSTRYAWDLSAQEGLRLFGVQHHHAHIASCMAENGIDEPVIGVAFDGTGYGPDGAIWGGEFLVGDYVGYRRAAHLKYLPLPGGEAAVRQPWRMALSYLLDSMGPESAWPALPPTRAASEAEVGIVLKQVIGGLNSPATSSAGRLFDAVASLVGVRHRITYEGQAAIELEMISDPDVDEIYEWATLPGEPLQVDMAPTIREIATDVVSGMASERIAGKFHRTVAVMIADTCESLREQTGVSVVALSGGVFQNLLLLEETCSHLERKGLRPLIHRQIPANDGGIALGQAAVASRNLSR